MKTNLIKVGNYADHIEAESITDAINFFIEENPRFAVSDITLAQVSELGY